MTDTRHRDGIAAHRLPEEEIAKNFADLHPPFDAHEAQVAADRCYFCYDAPCVAACPTAIDIPLFIRQIAGRHRPDAAARTIFASEHPWRHVRPRLPDRNPVRGRLRARDGRGQAGRDRAPAALRDRHADGAQRTPLQRAAPTGKRVAVVGAGPAGLACAHRSGAAAATRSPFTKRRRKPGGLNEYGIAAYKTVGGFAQAEVDWLMQIGGICVETGRRLGEGPRPRRAAGEVRRSVPWRRPRRGQRARRRGRGSGRA